MESSDSGITLPPLFPHFKAQLDSTTPLIQSESVLAPSNGDAPCFLILRNVLTAAECKAIIAASEQHGYEEAAKYCWQYRDRLNDRLMSEDVPFSQFLFQRIAPFVPETLNFGGLNNRWRYCRYEAGHHFGPHCDGTFGTSHYHCSFLTFMIYLNGPPEFQGGSTNFLKQQKAPNNVWKEVVPEAGTAVIFTQAHPRLLHEGAKLLSGRKYILRSDVMYTLPQELRD